MSEPNTNRHTLYIILRLTNKRAFTCHFFDSKVINTLTVSLHLNHVTSISGPAEGKYLARKLP